MQWKVKSQRRSNNLLISGSFSLTTHKHPERILVSQFLRKISYKEGIVAEFAISNVKWKKKIDRTHTETISIVWMLKKIYLQFRFVALKTKSELRMYRSFISRIHTRNLIHFRKNEKSYNFWCAHTRAEKKINDANIKMTSIFSACFYFVCTEISQFQCVEFYCMRVWMFLYVCVCLVLMTTGHFSFETFKICCRCKR